MYILKLTADKELSSTHKEPLKSNLSQEHSYPKRTGTARGKQTHSSFHAKPLASSLHPEPLARFLSSQYLRQGGALNMEAVDRFRTWGFRQSWGGMLGYSLHRRSRQTVTKPY